MGAIGNGYRPALEAVQMMLPLLLMVAAAVVVPAEEVVVDVDVEEVAGSFLEM